MIFSIAMGAEYLFYMKSIETHARAFLALIILGIGTVPTKDHQKVPRATLLDNLKFTLWNDNAG